MLNNAKFEGNCDGRSTFPKVLNTDAEKVRILPVDDVRVSG